MFNGVREQSRPQLVLSPTVAAVHGRRGVDLQMPLLHRRCSITGSSRPHIVHKSMTTAGSTRTRGGFAELREIFSELRFSDSSTTCGAGARGLGKITSGRAQPASRGSSRHFDSAPTIQSQSHVLVNERLPHFIPESTGYNRIEGSTSLTIGLQRLHRGKKTFLTA